MDETQTLAVRALRELLDDPDRNDWDELLAANRALIKAIETGEPMTRRSPRHKERAIYIRGHSDGERGLPLRSSEYGGWQREIYEKAYSKGFSCRHTW